MKIKFSYQPNEEKRAYLVCNLVIASLRKLDGKNPRVKERQEHPPIKHIYITSKPPSPMKGTALDGRANNMI